MVGYNLKEGKASTFKSWLDSKAAENIFKQMEKDCGFKFINTYFTILPSSTTGGDYDCYDW